jgi:hypothetical protein
MTDPVRYDVADAVATITLDQPDTLNALSIAMKVALREAVSRAATDDAVRAVVLTGAGRGFCVGQDLREHAEALEGGDTALSTVREHYNPIVTALADLQKPVVAGLRLRLPRGRGQRVVPDGFCPGGARPGHGRLVDVATAGRLRPGAGDADAR